MRRFFHVLLLFYDQFVFGYNVALNSNRTFLFGDILEPLCTVNISGQNLTRLEAIEMFHAWERYTSAQISSSSPVSEYRKAMPCFPVPNLNLSSSSGDMLPPYPDCETFVNISKTTFGEAEDLLEEMKKNDYAAYQVDVSLKSVINSLSNRVQNLIDYLPDGDTKTLAQTHLSSLVKMSIQPLPVDLPSLTSNHTESSYSPQNSTISPRSTVAKLRSSQLLSCFNLSSISSTEASSLFGQTLGSIACSSFSICSYSSVTSNQCLSSLNISESQFNSVINKTVGELIGQKLNKIVGPFKQKTRDNFEGMTNHIAQFFERLARSKRTPKPEHDNGTENDYEDVTLLSNSVEIDGREELEENYGKNYHLEHSKRTEKVGQFKDFSNAPDSDSEHLIVELNRDERIEKQVIDEGSGVTPNEVVKNVPKATLNRQEGSVLPSLKNVFHEDSENVNYSTSNDNQQDNLDGSGVSQDEVTDNASNNSLNQLSSHKMHPLENLNLNELKNSSDGKELLENFRDQLETEQFYNALNHFNDERNGATQNDAVFDVSDSPMILLKDSKEQIVNVSRNIIPNDLTSGADLSIILKNEKTKFSSKRDLEFLNISQTANPEKRLKINDDTILGKALDYFKFQTDTNGRTTDPPDYSLPDLNDSLNQAILTLLNTKLNSSMVEYSASFFNTTSLKQAIDDILPKLPSQFTISELFGMLNFNDSTVLKELLNSLQSVFANTSDFSKISQLISHLSASDLHMKVLELASSSNKTLNNSVISSILDNLKSESGSSRPLSISEVFEKISDSSALPSVIQQVLG